MSGWGTGWGCIEPKTEVEIPNDKFFAMTETGLVELGVDLAKPGSDETSYGVLTAEGWKQLTKEEFENNFKNIHPTHDPYTNPTSHIYYQCGCGAILDPGTKSFAALNNHASEVGWKVRWGADSYVPYCVKCGEDVE